MSRLNAEEGAFKDSSISAVFLKTWWLKPPDLAPRWNTIFSITLLYVFVIFVKYIRRQVFSPFLCSTDNFEAEFIVHFIGRQLNLARVQNYYPTHPKDDGRLYFQSVHTCGGRSGWWGGGGYPISGWMVGGYPGTPPTRSGWWGGYPIPGLDGGGVPGVPPPDQVWMVDWGGPREPPPTHETEQHSERLLCGGRCASWVHAGGLSCVTLFLLFKLQLFNYSNLTISDYSHLTFYRFHS